jgi:hypothetical protein
MCGDKERMTSVHMRSFKKIKLRGDICQWELAHRDLNVCRECEDVLNRAPLWLDSNTGDTWWASGYDWE